jgi:hypothetical protein
MTASAAAEGTVRTDYQSLRCPDWNEANVMIGTGQSGGRMHAARELVRGRRIFAFGPPRFRRGGVRAMGP